MKRIYWNRWLTVAMAVALAAPAARAADVEWGIAGAGPWDDVDNWVGPFLPQPGDRALVNNGGTVQITAATNAFDADSLWLAESSGEAGNLEMSGGELFANETRLGEGGTATANVTGGNIQVGSGSIFVGGRESEGVGELNVSGGTTEIRSGDDFQLGRIGTGTMNQSGGQIEGGFTVVGKFGTGIWNQSGGLFQARNDLEVGDGGRPDQDATPGPRTGTINLSGGLLHTNSSVSIGNRSGTGTVHVEGGTLAATGGNSATIYVGRGQNRAPGDGGPVELRVTGSDGTIVANGDFLMNVSGVATSSTLVAELTGADHTPIRVAGDADITNGSLAVELDGYAPVDGDSWLLIETGADLTAEKQAISDFVTSNNFNTFDLPDPAELGTRIGEFMATDLPTGFAVRYTPSSVFLDFTLVLLADFDKDGDVDGDDFLAWQSNFGTTTGATQAQGDSDGDGDVDGDDFLQWQSEFGAGTGSAGSAIPEPATWILCGLAAGLAAVATRRAPRG